VLLILFYFFLVSKFTTVLTNTLKPSNITTELNSL
jgi:hypothetical protein